MKLAHARRWALRSKITRLALVAALVLVMFLASFVESGMWALTYLAVGALSSLEEALRLRRPLRVVVSFLGLHPACLALVLVLVSWKAACTR